MRRLTWPQARCSGSSGRTGRKVHNVPDALRAAPRLDGNLARRWPGPAAHRLGGTVPDRLHVPEVLLYGNLSVSEPAVLSGAYDLSGRLQSDRMQWALHTVRADCPGGHDKPRPIARSQAASRDGLRLMHEPDILFLDEPDLGRGPDGPARIMEPDETRLRRKASPSWSRRISWRRPSMRQVGDHGGRRDSRARLASRD